jgi:hypothetical protein
MYKIKDIFSRIVRKVEISTDNGYTWFEAQVSDSKTSYKWVPWSYEWNASL